MKTKKELKEVFKANFKKFKTNSEKEIKSLENKIDNLNNDVNNTFCITVETLLIVAIILDIFIKFIPILIGLLFTFLIVYISKGLVSYFLSRKYKKMIKNHKRKIELYNETLKIIDSI